MIIRYEVVEVLGDDGMVDIDASQELRQKLIDQSFMTRGVDKVTYSGTTVSSSLRLFPWPI